jgi:hypothetical protein
MVQLKCEEYKYQIKMKDRYARQININRQSTNVPFGSVGLPVGTYGATKTDAGTEDRIEKMGRMVLICE